MNQKAYGSQEYRQQEVLGASPIRLVVMAYDLAILSCEKKDFGRATKAISLLRDALNFDTGDTAVGLFRLYQWCLDCIRQGDYDSASQTLRELREAWANVEKRLSPIQAQASSPGMGKGVNYPAYRAATS
jgi:flagellin-specific chaperone FliS